MIMKVISKFVLLLEMMTFIVATISKNRSVKGFGSTEKTAYKSQESTNYLMSKIRQVLPRSRHNKSGCSVLTFLCSSICLKNNFNAINSNYHNFDKMFEELHKATQVERNAFDHDYFIS